MGINKDQVDGRVKEVAGKVQEVAGRAVGSPTQELKGKLKKTIGNVQADYGDCRPSAKVRAERRRGGSCATRRQSFAHDPVFGHPLEVPANFGRAAQGSAPNGPPELLSGQLHMRLKYGDCLP